MNRMQMAATESDVLDLEERTWLPGYCKGDSSGFEKLIRQYRSMIYTYLTRYGIDHSIRDDLCQDVFIRIHQNAHTYKPARPLAPWIVTITVNCVRNFRRQQGRNLEFLKRFSEAHDDEQDEQAMTEDRLDQQAQLRWLEQEIRELPETQREVLVLTTLKGLKMKDIARIMSLPENTVKTHLRRARLALAEAKLQRDRLEDAS